LYEMDVAVRNLLLEELKQDERFGQQRLSELAAFLTDYVAQQLQSDDPDVRKLAQAQQWTSLAYTRPGEAVHKLAKALSELVSEYDREHKQEDGAELIRLASLTETFVEPLGEFEPLLVVYARAIANFARGNEEAAAQLVEKLVLTREVQVAGIRLSIPEHIVMERRVDYRNPFIVGGPVPPERFIGREGEVKIILDQLASPAHLISTAVSGEARIGKTSLLHYLSSPEVAGKWGLSPEKCTFIFMDSQTVVPFSPVGFWRYVLKSLVARKVHDPGYIEDMLQRDSIEGFELGELFDRIARDGKLVVLLLDEFEHIVEHINPDDPGFLYLLRALINRPMHGLALVLASRKPLP
ncbi:MAG: ATP-binding protein, partial [Desulfobacterales bacterium]|nr:ATP-binding protein [Desulfobacterales bacterium]